MEERNIMMNYELIVFKEKADLERIGTDGDGVQQGPVGDRTWQVLSAPSHITDAEEEDWVYQMFQIVWVHVGHR